MAVVYTVDGAELREVRGGSERDQQQQAAADHARCCSVFDLHDMPTAACMHAVGNGQSIYMPV